MTQTRRAIQALFLCCVLVSAHLLSPALAAAGAVRFPLPAAPPAPPAAPLASVSRSYANGPLVPPGPVDDSIATTDFVVLPGDFIPGSVVSKVTIDIAFSKVGGETCPGPGGGNDWAEEVRLRLFAPDGSGVTLVDFGDYDYSEPDVGPVVVTFDDDAPTSVVSLPIQSGTFRPSVGALANFVGLDPAANGGVWTLELADNWPEDPLCFISATLHITVDEQADLSIVKADNPDPVQAGELLSYQIAVHNAGPSLAAGVVVTDTLPAALEYLGNTAGCSPVAGELVCALGNIPAGGSRSLQILTRVPADAVAATPDGLTTTLNVATVASDISDANLADNTAEAATFIVERADLRVTKVSRPAMTVAAGETFTYTIAVDNGGPSFARGVVFSDTILSSGSFTLLGVNTDPLRADDCATVPVSAGLLIVCTLDDPLEVLGYGPANGRWTVGVRVQATEAQEVHNRVEVRAATPDADLANNQALDFISVTAVADLAVSKTGPAAVTAGGTAEFVVTVENDGPSAARNVVLEDELSAGMTVLSLVHPGMACSQSGGGPTAIRCGAGTLAAGASRTLTVTVAVDARLADGTQLVNSARVSGDGFDPDNGDNYVRLTAVVASSAVLSVAKNGTPGTAAAGERVDYTIAVSNNGPSAAQGVYVVDAMPAEMEVLSAGILRGVNGTPAGSGGACQMAAAEVACQLGQMPAGEQAAIVIAGRLRADAVPPSDTDGTIEVTNTVTVTASNATPQQAQATTTVQRLSDLQVDKSSNPAVAYAGDLVHYTVQVHNAGPSDAADAVVTDTLPAALDYQIDTGGCALVGTGPQVLRCELGAMAAGQMRTIDIHARVRPDIVPNSVAVNQVVVASAPADPRPANNTDTASTYLLGRADLRILKFGLPGGQVAAGQRLTYTIVVDNLGPGYAHDVTVSDQMLSSGTFHLLALASDRPATCDLTPPGTFTAWLEFTCALDDPLPSLAAGNSRWTLTVVVLANEAQALSNTAHVTGTDVDPNPGNNHASVQHQVTAAADVELVKAAVGQVQVDGMPASTFAPVADQVTAGGLLTYTLTAINHGPSTAHNIVLQDRLPAWIELLRVGTTQGLCNLGRPGDPTAPQVCNLGTLAAGRAATVTIVARVPAWLPPGHTFYNEAFVVSGSYDPLNSNDLAINLTTVNRWSDLEITKVGRVVFYPESQGMVYTVTVTNLGPSDAGGVVISDTLPAGLVNATWQCTARRGATCTAAGVGNLYETVDLPVGGTVVYTLQAMMPRWRGLTNTATATAGVGSNDPISGNNRATSTSPGPYILFMPVVAYENGGLSAPDLVVSAIVAATNGIQVTIKNQGSAAVTNGFWVDVYIDPSTPPRTVNQVWGSLSQQGIVWGVTSAALPLDPGETLLLTIGDAYYRADLSRVTWPLLLGTPVYAQVDSYNPDSLYGLVLETHEMTGGPYNNIMGPVNTSFSFGGR